MTFNETSYKRNCKKYTKVTTDLYVQRVRDAAAAGMLKRKPKDAVLTASVWMSRDEQSGKLTTAPGYGVKRAVKLPKCTVCGGKLKEYEPGSAMCENRDSEWRLTDGEWKEIA